VATHLPLLPPTLKPEAITPTRSSIYIGSTKGANHGAGGLTFKKVSIADLDIGWGNIV
jgi:hypothetical protein